jgi:hypothetical protein
VLDGHGTKVERKKANYFNTISAQQKDAKAVIFSITFG